MNAPPPPDRAAATAAAAPDDTARLVDEIDTLNRLLADLAVEERDAHTQLQSLKYAVQLTRGEVDRRQRANSELGVAPSNAGADADEPPGPKEEAERAPAPAPRAATPPDTISASLLSFFSGDGARRSAQPQSRSPSPPTPPPPHVEQAAAGSDEVTRLETRLQSVKRDVASVLFETEDLEAAVRRHRAALRDAVPVADEAMSPRLGGGSGGGGVSFLSDGAVSLPAAGTVAASAVGAAPSQPSDGAPQATTPGGSVAVAATAASPRLAGPKTSPRSRAARLIGDVDALLCFGDGAQFAPCRLGVSATGQLGVYSYASPVPVLHLDEAGARVQEISTGAERSALAASLVQSDVCVGGVTHRMCGLREAVSAALLLVRDAGRQGGGALRMHD